MLWTLDIALVVALFVLLLQVRRMMVALRGDLDIGAHFQPLHFKFCLVTHPSSLLLRGDEEDDDDYDDYAADDDGDDGDNFDNYGL